MSTLVHPLPPKKVWVDRQYLRDGKDSHGEYVEGYWVSAKAQAGRALLFETYLPAYGAVYDKLPLSAFRWFHPDEQVYVERPWHAEWNDSSLSPLQLAQYWNCIDTGIVVVEKPLLKNMRCLLRSRDNIEMDGSYWFTIDFYAPNEHTVDYQWAHVPSEHKSANVVALTNGRLAAYPNNRCRFIDASLSPAELLTPDFYTSSEAYSVEGIGSDYETLGDAETWAYDSDEAPASGATVFDEFFEAFHKNAVLMPRQWEEALERLAQRTTPADTDADAQRAEWHARAEALRQNGAHLYNDKPSTDS